MPPVIAAVVAFSIAAVGAIGVSGVVGAYLATALAGFIVAAGAGLVVWGVGTLLSSAGSALSGGSGSVSLAAVVNPLAPWNVQYGRGRVGGVVVFRNSFGDNDKYLDLVIVLACHPCESVDWLMLDNQKVQIGSRHNTANGWAGASFTPLQQTIAIPTTSDITRENNVVTVELDHDIPLLEAGDQVIVRGVHPVNLLFNGKFPVTSVIHTPGSPGSITFTYLSGGPAVPPGTVDESGEVVTTWVDYKAKIYMEVMLGTQALGETFEGMLGGTPYDGDWSQLQQNDDNPWTDKCSLLGKTAVFLRLHYNETVFANGVPVISFLLHGKNDIADYRTSPPTIGYTENAALCIADYLSDTTWGYKAVYGTDIPLAPLVAAANICDEAVPLAVPSTFPALTEPRYTCNGGFPLSMHRGEILGNLLTSCAGRLVYSGGQFVIWAAAWYGVTATITSSQMLGMLTGPFRWRSTQSVTNLFNGVKGTYVCPVNNWTPSDFPAFAQDVVHGYNWGTAPDFDQNLDDDGGDRRWLDVQLPFTISTATAQRIAKIELLRRRHQGTGTFPLNMAGYQFTPMDVISLDLPYFGWTGKSLEVLSARFKIDKQSDASGYDIPVLGTEIDVQETDASVYAWDIGEELSAEGYQQAIVPDNLTPAEPTNVVLHSQNNSIIIDWVAPADAFVMHGGHIEIQYQLVESPEGLWLSLGKMEPNVTQATIHNLRGGDQYYVRIRSVNAAGVPSEWVLGSPSDTSPLSPGAITVVGPGATYPWSPGYELPITGDANVIADGFGIQPVYEMLADGSVSAAVAIKGIPPINQISALGPPTIACFLGTIGTIEEGRYVIAVVAFDDETTNRNYGTTAFSNFVTVDVPSGGDGSITVNVAYQLGSHGGDIYVAKDTEFGGWHYEKHLTTGQITTDLTTIHGTGVGGPDPQFDHFAVVFQNIIHAGVWAQQVAKDIPGSPITPAVTATTVKIAGAAWTTDQWAGRVATLLAHMDSSLDIEIANFPILSNTADTLTVNGLLVQDLTTFLFPGDLICMRMQVTAVTVNSFSDSNLVNSFEPGLAVNQEVGNVAVVLYGLGAGQAKKIAANTSTQFTLASDWDIQPDSTSIIIIVSPQEFPVFNVQSTEIPNKITFTGVVARPDFLNLGGGVWLIQVFTVDVDGNFGSTATFREAYLFGSGGTIQVAANFTMLLQYDTYEIDTSAITGSSTTLAAAVSDTTTESIQVSNGTNIVNGTDILVDTERFRVRMGGGTAGPVTLTATRAAAGTTAATHSNGATVAVAGALLFTCLPSIEIPNKLSIVRKTSTDIHAVDVRTGGVGADQDHFPDGSTDIILPDTSALDGTTALKFPG